MHYELAFSSPFDIALSVGALLLLALPGSLPLLGLTGLAAAGALFWHMPVMLHHHYFLGLTGLAVAGGVAACALGAERERALYAPLRWMTILLYGAAAFHKMNPDFLAPVTGCGAQYLSSAMHRLGLQPPSPELAALGAWAGLAVELAIPCLLLVRKTRVAGVLLGTAFHAGLALMGYPRFSALMLALLPLFIDLRGLAPFGRRLAPAWTALRYCVLAAAAGYAVWKQFAPAARVPVEWVGGLDQALTAAILALCLSAPLIVLAAKPGRPERRLLRMNRWAIAVPALMALSALSPYLGLSTLQSFSMYSNLVTEGGRGNHVLLGATPALFDYQSDLVQIRSSSIAELQRYAEEGWTMPWVRLVRLVHYHLGGSTPIRIEYVRGGRIYIVDDARADHALSAPLPWFERKILSFRPIEIEGPRLCTF